MSIRQPLSYLFLALLLLAPACRSDSSGDDPDGGMSEPDGGPTEPPDNIEVCAKELAAPANGACDATQGSGSAVIVYGDVMGEETIYENGAVVYEGTTITCVGCDCDSAAGVDTATVISCPGSAVSPGLINPHDHLTFSEGTPIDTGTKRYDHRHQWRSELSTPSNPNGTGKTGDGNRWGELRMLMSGVTSMVGSGSASNLVRNLDRLEDGDRDLGFDSVQFQTFPLGDSRDKTVRPDCNWNYSDTESEAAEYAAFLPHVAEGIDEYAATEFRCQSTSFGDAEDFTESNVTHIHSIGLNSADYFNMARDGSKLLWSPRSNIVLYGMTAAVQTFHRLGGTISLGTDWSYSGSANMMRELACADQYNRNQLDGYFSDADLFKMATINAASSTASDTLIGSLAVGKLADIAIFSGDRRYYRAIIDGKNENLSLVVSAGNALVGDVGIMGALGKSCETVDVCGSSKQVCANQEFGSDYASIQSAVSGAYPAIFCGIPASEPTCVPSRPGEFTGVASDNDNDGDGIANASDNCPEVFNPIRPIDNGMQEDLDEDGMGDACDDSPLLADLDGDGVANALDNCPFDSNGDQVDDDNDSKGDTCDFCPTAPNPDGVCAEVVLVATIADIQNGTIAEGANVTINDVVVTAVYDKGYFVQDPANSGAFSGVHVYTGIEPGRTINEQISFTAKVDEFFTETQLKSANVFAMASGTAITPTLVTVAEAASEDYEGVLVTLSDAATYVDPYDCSVDGAGCNDAGLWEINGSVVAYDRLYSDADWAAQTSQPGVTGIMSFRYERRRIMPRSAADFAP